MCRSMRSKRKIEQEKEREKGKIVKTIKKVNFFPSNLVRVTLWCLNWWVEGLENSINLIDFF